ncbi:DUF5915 domain-containing protein [Candidatus Methanomethylophilus sp. 1R26]|uniref:DUF5915 domain-containing protein n=1 Tax=Candidatus Methanomethylophilus sp. 1R26 TaxID=1769296 RepID=UPI001F2E8872|nr:DUF5915 domain-containing protein [Candidatus Methanomethylophilus sp. 1R26]
MPFSEGELFIDFEITPEIEAEGYARELIRRIQQMRKDMKLNVEDYINVDVRPSPASPPCSRPGRTTSCPRCAPSRSSSPTSPPRVRQGLGHHREERHHRSGVHQDLKPFGKGERPPPHLFIGFRPTAGSSRRPCRGSCHGTWHMLSPGTSRH